MSHLSLVLERECLSLREKRDFCISEIKKLPIGYLAEKKIGKNKYFYRQWREGDTVKSQYIPKKSLDSVLADIEKRRKLERELKQINQDLSKLEGSGLFTPSESFKEAIIRQVDGSMAIEGMSLTDEDKERIRNYAFDASMIDQVVAGLVEKHSVARG